MKLNILYKLCNTNKKFKIFLKFAPLKLNLSYYRFKLTNNRLENICKKLSGIIELDIYGCKQITDLNGLLNCPKLKSLNITRCFKIKDLSILEKLKNLKELKLYDCNQIPDEQIIKLQKALPDLIIFR